MIFLLYLFACLGMSYAWSDTEASRPFRNFIAKIPYIRKPLLCHECSSFWVCLFLSIFLNPFQEYAFDYISNILSAFSGFFVNLVFIRRKLIPFKD